MSITKVSSGKKMFMKVRLLMLKNKQEPENSSMLNLGVRLMNSRAEGRAKLKIITVLKTLVSNMTANEIWDLILFVFGVISAWAVIKGLGL